MLQAMNTGHEGSLTTLHANTPRDGLARLETMVLMAGMELPLTAIREQISSGAITRQTLANALRGLGRSQGVTGELRMSTQRELERPIHILTLDSGIIKKTE